MIFSVQHIVKLGVHIHALGDWESKVKEYLADLQAGLESLNAKPQSEEDAREIFEIKRQTVNTLVRRVTIDRNRKLHVKISLNLLNFVNDDRSNRLEGQNKNKIKPVGIHLGWRDDS